MSTSEEVIDYTTWRILVILLWLVKTQRVIGMLLVVEIRQMQHMQLDLELPLVSRGIITLCLSIQYQINSSQNIQVHGLRDNYTAEWKV